MSDQTFLVTGATGRTGRIIVGKLLLQGLRPHVLVRSLPAAKLLLGDGPFFHHGDLRSPGTLIAALHEIDVIISAAGTRTPVGKNCPKHVDYEGVANLVKAAHQHGVDRMVLISSIAVTRPKHPLNRFGRILDWKLKGENTLRESGLSYVIIRPGGLKDCPGGERQLIFDQGDRLMGTITREDVADLCLLASGKPELVKTTFEVIESDHKRTKNWEPDLSMLSRD